MHEAFLIVSSSVLLALYIGLFACLIGAIIYYNNDDDNNWLL